MAKFIPRFISNLVIEDLKDIDAVFINGPRQAGKSTFVQIWQAPLKPLSQP